MADNIKKLKKTATLEEVIDKVNEIIKAMRDTTMQKYINGNAQTPVIIEKMVGGDD